MKINVLIVVLVLVCAPAFAQDTIIPLWNKKIPNQLKSTEVEKQDTENILWITNVQNPTIEVYLPAKRNRNGQAVVIFPGGGYQGLAYDWEGTDMAKMLNSHGIAGVVVKYRLPVSKSLIEKKYVPLQDAQRAIRLVRRNSQKFGIDSKKIGIMGFSAGGHLASTLGTHFDKKVYKPQDDIDSLSARPDFMALIYPVISFGEFTHKGSKGSLLGDNPTQEQIEEFSNEKQVTAQTPPTFLVHSVDDGAVPVENSVLFFQALKAHNVPVDMHIYQEGGHGYSLALNNPKLSQWVYNLVDWLKQRQ
jgi:acetyl esterase/lipase